MDSNATSRQAVSEEDAAAFESIVSGRSVQALYQPIVELDSAKVVGWEALARGPAGSPLQFPDRLFGVAAALGRVAELDFVCRCAAVDGALAAGLGRQQELFVNVEPSATTLDVPGFLRDARRRASEHLLVTVEITERALTTNPAELMSLVGSYRRQGWGLALDDVGVDPRSVSLMPFIRPDVIKLDMTFVQETMTRDRARTVHAVVAEAERSGARLLAEGIETPEHLEIARALGADLGQGWFFGRPGQLKPSDEGTTGTGRTHTAHLHTGLSAETPFETLRALRRLRRGTKRQLLQMSLALEEEAVAQGHAAVLLSTFQEAEYFTPHTQRRYERIARSAAFVGALAGDLIAEPVSGVRGVSLDTGEALRGEWDVVVIAPHFAGAFVACDMGDAGPDMDRRFDYAITYDRDLVTVIAVRLMQRVAPERPL